MQLIEAFVAAAATRAARRPWPRSVDRVLTRGRAIDGWRRRRELSPADAAIHANTSAADPATTVIRDRSGRVPATGLRDDSSGRVRVPDEYILAGPDARQASHDWISSHELSPARGPPHGRPGNSAHLGSVGREGPRAFRGRGRGAPGREPGRAADRFRAAQESRSSGQGEVPGVRHPGAPRSAAVALARLVPANGLISVGARPGSASIEIKVKEGDQVSRGRSSPILEGHAAAQHQLVLAKAQRTLDDRQQRARLAAARKAAEASKTRLERSDHALQAVRRDVERARIATTPRWRSTRSRCSPSRPISTSSCWRPRSSPRHRECPEGSRTAGERGPEDEILDAQVELAEAALKEAEVRAPGPGRVLRILVHPGELSAGTLLEMGDVSSMAATAEVYQSDRAADPSGRPRGGGHPRPSRLGEGHADRLDGRQEPIDQHRPACPARPARRRGDDPARSCRPRRRDTSIWRSRSRSAPRAWRRHRPTATAERDAR